MTPQPPKKPACSALYLKAAAANQARLVDALPPTKEHWHEYERLLELARRIRKMAGFSPWPAVAFASSLVVVITLWMASRTRHTYFFQHPDNYLRVVQNLDPCEADGTCGSRYLMQAVVGGKANPATEMRFCGKQRFEAGHTLAWIRYTDLGNCQAIDGWDVVREGDIATLAPNCSHDWVHNHNVCEGGKAKF